MSSKEILDVLILDNQDRCAALWVYRTADETPANWTLVTPDNGYLALTPLGYLYAYTNGAWVDQGGGGAHPNLATHDALGLATDTELTTHAGAADPHTGYRLESVAIAAADVAADVATQAELDAHAAAADPHTIYQKESEKGAVNGYASLDAGGTVPDAQIPATIARDSELHTRLHSVIGASDHNGFPGGTGTFLRADATFAAPPGGSEAFPVGSVFIAVVATNPATLLGYGTWAAIAAGRVLVGLDAADPDFDLVQETGGAKTHGHSDNLSHSGAAVGNHVFTQPAGHSNHVVTQPNNHLDVLNHVHRENRNSATTGGLDGWAAGDTSTNTPLLTGYSTANPTTGGVAAQVHAGAAADAHSAHAGGAVDAHGVTQPSAHASHAAVSSMVPYLVVYMWSRTA